MANLTITVHESVLRRARARAAERGTTINTVLSEYLVGYAGSGAAAEAVTEFLNIAATVDATSGPEGRTWTREDLHDRTDLR